MKFLLVLACLISSSVFGVNVELGGFSDDLLRERAKEFRLVEFYTNSLIENTNHRQLGAKDYESTMSLKRNFDGFLVVFDEKYQEVKAVSYVYILSQITANTLSKGEFGLSQTCMTALAENLEIEKATLRTLFPASKKLQRIIYNAIDEEIDSCFDILGFFYYASRHSLESKTSIFNILRDIKDPIKLD